MSVFLYKLMLSVLKIGIIFIQVKWATIHISQIRQGMGMDTGYPLI